MNMFVKALILLTGLFLNTLWLSGCSSDEEKPEEVSEKLLYETAQKNLKNENFILAVKNLQLLEARYPFGPYAEQAQLDTAYAYFKFDEPDTAISSANRFIKLHPRHVNVDYAYYLRGLASTSKKDDPLDAYLPQDSSFKDPSSTQKSYDYFALLVKKFPESRYAEDAIQRMGHLRNSLAMHEIHVANYYVKRGAFVAVVNRAKYVISNFPRTPASRLALQLMVDGYKELKMDNLAADAQRVLDLNPVVVSAPVLLTPPEI